MSTTKPRPERLSVGGDEVVVRVGADESGGALLVLDVAIPPGGGPPALHRHEPAEVYRVEEGELAFYRSDDGGEPRRGTAGPGDVVHIPGGAEHTIRNESGRTARASVTFVPGAPMEAFVRAAAALDPGRATMDEVVALAARHGVRITRPLGR